METIILEKKDYSNLVVRQSLYWMNGISDWTLEEQEDIWKIYFSESNKRVLYIFHQLLNDYILREKIDFKTRDMRSSIINKVLKSIDERLS